MKSGLKYLLLLSLFIFKGHDHASAANYVGSLSQTAVYDVQGDKISDCNDQKDPVYWLLDNLLTLFKSKKIYNFMRNLSDEYKDHILKWRH